MISMRFQDRPIILVSLQENDTTDLCKLQSYHVFSLTLSNMTQCLHSKEMEFEQGVDLQIQLLLFFSQRDFLQRAAIAPGPNNSFKYYLFLTFAADSGPTY